MSASPISGGTRPNLVVQITVDKLRGELVKYVTLIWARSE